MTARPRGVSLVEALIAVALLSFGVFALGPWQAGLAHGTAAMQQQSQALQMAESELEAMRARDTPDASAGTSLTSIAGTIFGSERRVAADATAASLAWIVDTVNWRDGVSGLRTLMLATAASRTPAELSAVLVAPRDRAAGSRMLGRAPAVPVTAVDRGDGRSVFAPLPGAAVAFVFDNGSGHVVARCTDTQALACAALDGLLLSGWIRVSLATPPDAVQPDDTALPISLDLRLTQGRLVEPGCVIERRDGALAYHCVIATDGGAWSGRIEIVAPGSQACRYAPSNPERYDHVDRPLMQQNFLVIRDGQGCPVVPPSPALPDGIVTLPTPA